MILSACSSGGKSRKELEGILEQNGLDAFSVYVLEHLEEWKLVKKEKGLYYALVSCLQKPPLTNLQLSWIQAILEEEKIFLFLTKEDKEKWSEKWKGISPLYQQDFFSVFDRYDHGDPFLEEGYQKRFHIICKAVEKKQILYLKYENRRGEKKEGSFFPKQLEYSSKDNKIRLYSYRLGGNRPHNTILNLGRIFYAEPAGTAEPSFLQGRMQEQKKKEEPPVVLRISKERNSLERTMLHFANYKKRTEYDEKSGEYLCRIYYDKKDETELLIRVLSFVPMVRVLEPPSFLHQVKERIFRQNYLLQENKKEKGRKNMEQEKILQLVDHTILSQIATWEEVKQICIDAIKFQCASVCIPPSYVKQAKEFVKDRMKICTVIGFPNGYSTKETKLFETKNALENGAEEIDMVINLGWVKDQKWDLVEEEISELKQVCGNKILKVIVETCFLTEEEKKKLCYIVVQAGADFIKTSTGFGSAGAKTEDIGLFTSEIGSHAKIKAAGGIRTFEMAETMIQNGAHRLGASALVKLAREQKTDVQ